MKDAYEKALDIIKGQNSGVMSYIAGDTPLARYMTFFNEGFSLYTLTSKQSGKIDDLEKNSNVHILIGQEGLFNQNFVDYSGKVSFSDNQSVINRLWSPSMNYLFTSKDDPDIIVLKIEPQTINLCSFKSKDIEEVDFTGGFK